LNSALIWPEALTALLQKSSIRTSGGVWTESYGFEF